MLQQIKHFSKVRFQVIFDLMVIQTGGLNVGNKYYPVSAEERP